MKTKRIIEDAYQSSCPVGGEGWDEFTLRLENAMLDMEALLREGRDGGRTDEPSSWNDRVNAFLDK